MSVRNPGKLTHGQLINPGKGTIRKFTQKEYPVEPLESNPPGYGNVNTEITVTDANSVLVKVFDVDALAAAQLAFPVISYETNLSFNLPAILTAVSIVYNSNTGIGADQSVGSGYADGSPFQLALQSSGKSSGSSSIVPDALPIIKQPVAEDLLVTGYEFYLVNGYSKAALLAKLTAAAGATVHAWPVFQPEVVTLSLHGQTTSLSANAEVHKSKFLSDAAQTLTSIVEQGFSTENGVTIRTHEITPTLHAAIVLSSTTQTANVTASASAGWVGTGVFPSGSAASNPTHTVANVTGTASPSPVGAYTPSSTFNGFPVYIFGSFYLFNHGDGKWRLQAGGIDDQADYWLGDSSGALTPTGPYTHQGTTTGTPSVAMGSTSVFTISGAVFPTTIPATTPTDIPRTGLYLKKISSVPDEETGNIGIVAYVVDMSLFA